MFRRLCKLASAALLAAIVCGCAMMLADGRERVLRGVEGQCVAIPAEVNVGVVEEAE